MVRKGLWCGKDGTKVWQGRDCSVVRRRLKCSKEGTVVW